MLIILQQITALIFSTNQRKFKQQIFGLKTVYDVIQVTLYKNNIQL